MKINAALALSALVSGLVALSACGVRGNPQPPMNSPELGHGEPGFKRASEEFAFPNVPSPTPIAAPGSREEIR